MERAKLVSSLRTVTVALGTCEPLASVMTPRILLCVDCASADPAAEIVRTMIAAAIAKRRIFIGTSMERSPWDSLFCTALSRLLLVYNFALWGEETGSSSTSTEGPDWRDKKKPRPRLEARLWVV